MQESVLGGKSWINNWLQRVFVDLYIVKSDKNELIVFSGKGHGLYKLKK